MPTEQEKNIAIAEMLGLVTGNAPEGAVTSNGGKYTGHVFYDNLEEEMWYLYPAFHSDANWQYEAIEWIENLRDEQGYGNMVTIWCNGCCIAENNAGYKIIDNLFRPTKREAVFEALYQFSKYLKEKKDAQTNNNT